MTTEAQHFEAAQDWINAVKSYQQILAISPNSTTAQQGLEQSLQRATFLARLDEHLNNKLRLGSGQVANEAKQLLQEVALINSPGSKIDQRALKLNELIQLARQPIPITLQSDNLTDITIFKVGKFGKFEQHKLKLKTGKYTILGSRPGFRDVRKVVTVSAEMSSKTLQIRCEEPI